MNYEELNQLQYSFTLKVYIFSFSNCYLFRFKFPDCTIVTFSGAKNSFARTTVLKKKKEGANAFCLDAET